MKIALAWNKWWLFVTAFGMNTFNSIIHTSTAIHITIFLLTFTVFVVLWSMTITDELE